MAQPIFWAHRVSRSLSSSTWLGSGLISIGPKKKVKRVRFWSLIDQSGPVLGDQISDQYWDRSRTRAHATRCLYCNEMCAQRELMKCIDITMNSITMWENQFVHYIILTTVRFARPKAWEDELNKCYTMLTIRFTVVQLWMINLSTISYSPQSDWYVIKNSNTDLQAPGL